MKKLKMKLMTIGQINIDNDNEIRNMMRKLMMVVQINFHNDDK
jgi:hypothetical protein